MLEPCSYFVFMLIIIIIHLNIWEKSKLNQFSIDPVRVIDIIMLLSGVLILHLSIKN